MDNYTKGAVEEYIERQRKSLEELYNDPTFLRGAVDDIEQHIESRLENVCQSIEKDLLTNHAYATLLFELEAKERKLDDSTFYVSLTDIAKMNDFKNPSYVIQGWLRDRNTIDFLRMGVPQKKIRAGEADCRQSRLLRISKGRNQSNED